jgi:hypothetical protein
LVNKNRDGHEETRPGIFLGEDKALTSVPPNHSRNEAPQAGWLVYGESTDNLQTCNAMAEEFLWLVLEGNLLLQCGGERRSNFEPNKGLGYQTHLSVKQGRE